MADIQSPTAEIRRGEKERKKEETTEQSYNGLPYSIGRPQLASQQGQHPLTGQHVPPITGGT